MPMSLLPLLLPLVAQVGPASALPSAASPYASSLPIEIIEKKEDEARRARASRRAAQGAPLAYAPAGIGCMAAVETDPERSAQLARTALSEALGREKVRAGLCLGVALSTLDRWDEARSAFVDARDAADSADHSSRARLGAMAGNAALAAGQPGEALSLLAPAATEAKIAGDQELTASIALDRARALVAVKQLGEAAAALAEARAAQPGNAQAWLLSATLSRRENKLAEAQAEIEKAASLAPQDPEIGLEAGVIAMLSGNEPAARRSWESVLATGAGSDSAAIARQYLAQSGTETTQNATKATP